MNRTKKFAATVGLGVALALGCTAPALADCEDQGPVQQAPVQHQEEHAPEFTGGGNTCVNTGGASASAVVVGSPGVLSGNNVQIPISIPINICGNSVNVVGVGNPVGGGGNN
ncbi:chaplin [Kitasatospora sp. NPDC101801]|uniref:chaplin n=1 Tax=Kitasatospora sp. NPDC101801 TaxID=3364103 RepID=UPI0038033BEE